MSELNQTPLERESNQESLPASEKAPLSIVLLPLLMIVALIVWYRFS